MKHLFKVSAILLTTLCLSIVESFAQTGSTGRPNTDWEIDKICWAINGVDSSLTRRSLFVEATNNDEPVFTKYYDASGSLVDVSIGGTITLGLCKDAVESQTTKLDHSIVEMCDNLNDTLFTPFIRVYMIVTDIEGATLTTSVATDMTYNGAPYNVTGIAGLGLCALVEDEVDIDKEYSVNCMVDVQVDGNEITFYRIFNHHDSTTANVDNLYGAYTITGTVKPCSDIEVVSMKELCDVTKKDIQLDYTIIQNGNIVELTRTSSLTQFIGVTNQTFDCGQGQTITGNNVPFCNCDYSDSPDNVYFITMAVDVTFGGTLVVQVGGVTVNDGQVSYTGSNAMNFSQSQVITAATPFFRQFKQDGTFKDIDLNNNAYTVTGAASKICDNKDRFNQVFEPSTRPHLDVIGSDECWEKYIPSSNTVSYELTLYQDAVIGGPDLGSIVGMEINGGANASANLIPLNFPQGETKSDRKQAVRAIQEALISAGVSYASVTSKDSIIRIIGLPDTITDIKFFNELNDPSADEYNVYEMQTYDQGDTTLFYTVYRYVNDGREALAIDHFGNETYLPADAVRVRCSADDENECQVSNTPKVEILTGGTFDFNAGEWNAIDIAPMTAGVIVTVEGESPVSYPSWFANRLAAGECKFLNKKITIDVSAPGVSALVTSLK